jgi:hypothetical protein
MIPIWKNEVLHLVEREIQLLLLLFSELLAQTLSITKHLIKVQHEKHECHANERSYSKYRYRLVILPLDRGASMTDQVNKA